MFTGLVEEVGTIASIVANAAAITASPSSPEHREGVEGRQQRRRQRSLPDRARHHARIVLRRPGAETWTRTSFSRITEGAQVNLELPLKADGRMGGHIVQGHVDGAGTLRRSGADCQRR